MMSYKVETVKEQNTKITRTVRSYKTEQNARKAMQKQAIELGLRKERKHIDGFRITLIHDNMEIGRYFG